MSVRSRHASGVTSRGTHTQGGVDFAVGTEPLYGSQMDLEAVTVLDLGAGSVTEGAFPPGGLDARLILRAGTVPVPLDYSVPAVPLAPVPGSDIMIDSTGVPLVRLTFTVTHPTVNVDSSPLTDYFGMYVEATRDLNAVTLLPDWTNAASVLVPADETAGAYRGAAGNSNYYLRGRGSDTNGNLGGWSSVAGPYRTVKDTTAPLQPVNFSAAAGFCGAALQWDAVGAADLFAYQVRWGSTAGVWTGGSFTFNTVFWVPGLVPGTLYYFQVRSIDTSDNTGDGAYPQVSKNYIEDPDWGYTASATCTPTSIGTSDIAAATIRTVLLNAGGITADLITAGKMTVKATGASALEVYGAGSPGPLVGDWSPASGIRVYGAATGDFLSLNAGQILMYKGGVQTVQITPDGIYADSIRTGTLDGGHNVVRNSSFEMSSMVTNYVSVSFTDAAAWQAANRATAPDNVTEGAALTMTSVTY